MGIVANMRGSRAGTTQEGLPLSDGVSQGNRRKWSNFMPLYVALVVIAEIALLGRPDMANKAAFVDTLADLFYRSPSSPEFVMENDDSGVAVMSGERNIQTESCEEWLEREDAVVYSRDFEKDPIWVSGGEQKDCSVGCKFGFISGKKPDAIFAPHGKAGTAAVLRSMESSHESSRRKPTGVEA